MLECAVARADDGDMIQKVTTIGMRDMKEIWRAIDDRVVLCALQVHKAILFEPQQDNRLVVDLCDMQGLVFEVQDRVEGIIVTAQEVRGTHTRQQDAFEDVGMVIAVRKVAILIAHGLAGLRRDPKLQAAAVDDILDAEAHAVLHEHELLRVVDPVLRDVDGQSLLFEGFGGFWWGLSGEDQGS
jgi:hypothetical protein